MFNPLTNFSSKSLIIPRLPLKSMIQVRIYGRFKSLFKNPNLELPNDENVGTLKDPLFIIKKNYSEEFYKEIVDEKSNNLEVGVILTIMGKA